MGERLQPSVRRASDAELEGGGAQVVEGACVIELPDLKGRAKVGDAFPLYTLLDIATGEEPE